MADIAGAGAGRTILGESVPERVAAYYDAVDNGRFKEALDQLAPAALVALPPDRRP